MVNILDQDQIKNLKGSAKVLNIILKNLADMIKPGISGWDLDQAAQNMIVQYNCQSNFKGYFGYPNTICVSVNSDLIHGIPNQKPFQNGDIVSVDVGCIFNKLHSDAAFTKIVGEAKKSSHIKLVNVTRNALLKALNIIRPGIRTGDISNLIQNHVTQNGFYLPTEYAGHGIGMHIHEDPSIPNVGSKNTGARLHAGMAICIEPMVQIATQDCVVLEDKWTVRNAQNQPSAHFEATILITETGCEPLTTIIY